MARMYCTADYVRALIGSPLNKHDLDSAIEAATVRIEQETGRVFEASESEARTFEVVRGAPHGYCPIDDLLSATAVAWEGAALTAEQYKFTPSGPRLPKLATIDLAGQWTEGDELAITGVWGYSAIVPADLKEACAAWVARMVKWADTGFEDVTAVPELGQLVYNRAVPEAVRRVLDRYRRVAPR